MINVEVTESAFDGANSTLFLLLGGLSRLQQIRRALPPAPRRRRFAGANSPEPLTSKGSDPVTLALLGLLSAGLRLEQLSGQATGVQPRDSRAARRAKRRKTVSQKERGGTILPRVLLR